MRISFWTGAALAASALGCGMPGHCQGAVKGERDIPALIQQQLGAGVEPVQGGWFFTDLNGDGRNDLVALVQIRSRAGLARDVVVQNPWKPVRPASRVVNGVAIAVIQGGARGLEQPAPGGKLVLSDSAFFRTPIWTSGQAASNFGMAKKGSVKGLPRSARGDSIRLGTEAGIDIHLYWDGRTYKLYQPNEEP